MGEKLTRRRVLAGAGTLGGSLAALGGVGVELAPGEGGLPAGWPMAEHDPAGTCHAQNERGPKERPVVAWRRRSVEHYDGAYRDVPIVADGTVYAVGRTLLAAEENGTVRGRVDRQFGAPPVVVRSEVYGTPTVAFPTDSGAVGIDPDAEVSIRGYGPEPVRWRAGGRESLSIVFRNWSGTSSVPPIAAEGTVVVAEDGLTAIDANAGTIEWRISQESGPLWRPAMRLGNVYTTASGHLVAVDVKTGTRSVLAELEDTDGLWGMPTAATACLLVSDQNRLWGFGYDGSPEWEYEPEPGTLVGRAIAVADGVAFVGVFGGDGIDSPGGIAAVDVEDGTELWRSGPEPRKNPAYRTQSVAVADGVVYFNAGGDLVALDAGNGDVLWRFDEHRFTSPPAVAGGRIYVLGRRYLYALEEP